MFNAFLSYILFYFNVMFGLNSTGWCVLGCWLTICAVQTSFFLAVTALECAEIFVDVYRP
jgi:hypothetical protein